MSIGFVRVYKALMPNYHSSYHRAIKIDFKSRSIFLSAYRIKFID